jgi:peptidyl-prolyl cis-trans isomerase D
MDALRSFLSGPRLAIIGILLAIPFVFFGSSSFGTVFTNYGKVNGLTVSALDVNIAINSVTSRLQQIYGDDFTVESLEEGIFNNLVRNEIVSQKALLYQVKQMNLVNSEDEAKRLIMSEPSFQTDGLFDQNIFEATIRQNGILPNEYIENIQNSTLVNDFLLAISDSSFQIEAELKNQIRLIEQERSIDFFKIDFNALKSSINPTLENALEYYESNQLLFMDDEKRSFNLLSISQDRFKELVDIPEDFIENEYKDYLERINALAERRISHIMVEASNYASKDDAYNALLSIQNKIGNDLTFEEAAEQFSEDLASADQQGDLGFSSGDSFPPEFIEALDSMSVGSLSGIIELEELGSFHIIKFTEENKETPKSKESMSKQFLSELLEAESYALMLDLRDEIEDLLLSGLSVEAIANEFNLEFSVSNKTSYEDFEIYDNPAIRDFLYGIDFPSDFAEIFELDDRVLVASVSEVVAPSVLPFDQVTDDVFERLRIDQANLDLVDLTNDLVAAINDDTFVLDNSNVLQDSFTSVKRGSSLFPANVLNEIFSSSIDSVQNIRAFNSDIYVFKVTKITEPSDDFISSIITDYDNFSSTTSLVKLNLIIEKEINSRIRDNIKNLNI